MFTFWKKKRRVPPVVQSPALPQSVTDHVLSRYLSLTLLLPGTESLNVLSDCVSQLGADFHGGRGLRAGQTATVQILLRSATVRGTCRIVSLPTARDCGRIEWDFCPADRERLESFLVSSRRSMAV